MLPWLSFAADPGRVHTDGKLARGAVEQAREQVAALLGARPREVVFTSGATEAIATAWPLLVASSTFGYLAPVLSDAFEAIFNTASGEAPPRALFQGKGSTIPATRCTTARCRCPAGRGMSGCGARTGSTTSSS